MAKVAAVCIRACLSCAKSLFVRMGFVKRACTTARPDIPEGAKKEAELIVRKVEDYPIPSSLVINIDQTPLKYAPAFSRTMASKNSNMFTWLDVHTSKPSLVHPVSPCQEVLTNATDIWRNRNTKQSLKKFKFSSMFSLSVNPKHFSNTEESIKLLEEIIRRRRTQRFYN